MPLRSIIDGKDINSFDLTKEEWNDLKRNYHTKDLKTVCCGNKAIPKTSNLGTQFFAHSRRFVSGFIITGSLVIMSVTRICFM